MKRTIKNKVYEVKLCNCGCGEKVKWNKLFRKLNNYVDGHDPLIRYYRLKRIRRMCNENKAEINSRH